jgi:hypothetical protein
VDESHDLQPDAQSLVFPRLPAGVGVYNAQGKKPKGVNE